MCTLNIQSPTSYFVFVCLFCFVFCLFLVCLFCQLHSFIAIILSYLKFLLWHWPHQATANCSGRFFPNINWKNGYEHKTHLPGLHMFWFKMCAYKYKLVPVVTGNSRSQSTGVGWGGDRETSAGVVYHNITQRRHWSVFIDTINANGFKVSSFYPGAKISFTVSNLQK